MKHHYWRLFEVAADQGAEPVEEAPDPGASVVQDAPPETSADAPPWASEHPDWKPEDVWKSYTELRTRFSRGEHQQEQQPAEPEEPAYDPYAQLGPGDDERTLDELHRVFRGESALNDGTRGPQAVMDLILQSEAAGQPVVSEQWKQNYFAAWQQTHPWAAQQYAAEYTSRQHEERLRQEIEQSNAPYRSRVQYGVNETALAKAAERIPEWQTWGPKVMDFLMANPHWIDDVKHDPDLMVQRMGQAYAMLAWEQAGAQPPPAAAQPTPANGKQPRSATRNAAPPTEDDDRVSRELANLSRLRGK